MWQYTEKVMDHFLHPRNVGEIEKPDAVGEVGSMACGDALRLTLRIDSEERIADARFKTFGCASAIASSSILTEMVKGKTLAEALAITSDDVVRELGGLPREKMHCSVLGTDALEAAVADYRGVTAPRLPGDGSEVVCHCFGASRARITRIVRDHRLSTLEEITHYCKAGGGCGGCHPSLEEIIEEAGVLPRARSRSPRRLTNIQKITLIQEIMEKEIRPTLQADGGDIELVDVEGNRVLVALRGACAGCMASQLTLKTGVEARLREFVSEDLVVEEAE